MKKILTVIGLAVALLAAAPSALAQSGYDGSLPSTGMGGLFNTSTASGNMQIAWLILAITAVVCVFVTVAYCKGDKKKI